MLMLCVRYGATSCSQIITLISDVHHEQLYCLLLQGWKVWYKYIPWPNANTILHALPQAIHVYRTSQMNLNTMYHGYHSWFLNNKCINTYRWVQYLNWNTIYRISTVIYCTSQELYTLVTLQLIYFTFSLIGIVAIKQLQNEVELTLNTTQGWH